MHTVGKRAPRAATLIPSLSGNDPLSVVRDARESFIDAVAIGMLNTSAEGHLPFLEDAAALVLVEVAEPWLSVVAGVCQRVLGCRGIRLHYTSIGDRPDLKAMDRQLSENLANGRSTAVLASSLDDLPGYLLPVADLALRVGAPTAEEVLSSARATGLPMVDQDLDGADLAQFTPRLVETAWRTPHAGQNAERVAVALRAASVKPQAAAPALSFDDLPGLGDVEDWGRNLAADLRAYRVGDLSWQDVDGGLLLSGPPGTGKTKFAAALAHECGVPLIAASPARWQASRDGHLGTTLRAMRESFDAARKAAPCILHLDELDSVGSRDTHEWNRDYSSQVVNALLECLDGVDARAGVVVLATTNHPDRLDPALRRAGRLDRHLRLGLPDTEARAAILERYTGLPSKELGAVARRMAGAPGAELEAVARDARRLARTEGEPVNVLHLLTAAAARQAEAVVGEVDLAALMSGPTVAMH